MLRDREAVGAGEAARTVEVVRVGETGVARQGEGGWWRGEGAGWPLLLEGRNFRAPSHRAVNETLLPFRSKRNIGQVRGTSEMRLTRRDCLLPPPRGGLQMDVLCEL